MRGGYPLAPPITFVLCALYAVSVAAGWIEVASMIGPIIELLNANLNRVRNLKDQYDSAGQGRRSALESDILRAALVLLHASMEDFLRQLLVWRAPLGSKFQIDKYPLAGSDTKNANKFFLGSLVEHRGLTVDQLIAKSVEEHVENYKSFNNIGDVKDTLKECGVPADAVDRNGFADLSDLISRRHKIVHKADRNDVSAGQGNHRTASISSRQVNRYFESVESLRDFVQHNLSE